MPGEGEDTARFLRALDELDRALEETVELVDAMRRHSSAIRDAHRRGESLREIVPSEEGPRLVQLLTLTTNLLHSYGNRVRIAEAQALHQEGMTMDQIAALFGVSRQRVSALLHTRPPDGEPET